MRSRAELATSVLENGQQTLIANLKDLTLDEALAAAGGYRSVLGILKHTAAWSHVYWSYAFASDPKHWDRIEWPRGLPQDIIDPSTEYVDEVIAWFEGSVHLWLDSIRDLSDEVFDEDRPLHFGVTPPLFDIVAMVANHWCYHAGELNEILAISRGEAWEYTEEVEENHVSTAGHRLRPGWMDDEFARNYEVYLAARDEEISARHETDHRP